MADHQEVADATNEIRRLAGRNASYQSSGARRRRRRRGVLETAVHRRGMVEVEDEDAGRRGGGHEGVMSAADRRRVDRVSGLVAALVDRPRHGLVLKIKHQQAGAVVAGHGGHRVDARWRGDAAEDDLRRLAARNVGKRRARRIKLRRDVGRVPRSSPAVPDADTMGQPHEDPAVLDVDAVEPVAAEVELAELVEVRRVALVRQWAGIGRLQLIPQSRRSRRGRRETDDVAVGIAYGTASGAVYTNRALRRRRDGQQEESNRKQQGRQPKRSRQPEEQGVDSRRGGTGLGHEGNSPLTVLPERNGHCLALLRHSRA